MQEKLVRAKLELEEMCGSHQVRTYLRCMVVLTSYSLLFPLQKVYILSADVSSVDIKDKLLEAVAANGHVDVLINCAGMTHTAALVDTPMEKYEVCCPN